MEYTDLSCIRCQRKFTSEPVIENGPPSNGTIFISHGNYGSTVWDPVSRDYLLIIVCDACLLAVARENRVMIVKPIVTRVTDVKEPWDPETYTET